MRPQIVEIVRQIIDEYVGGRRGGEGIASVSRCRCPDCARKPLNGVLMNESVRMEATMIMPSGCPSS